MSLLISLRRPKLPLPLCILLVIFWSFSLNAQSQSFDAANGGIYYGGNGSGNDDDTILVEQEVNFKLSYSRAIKAFCINVLSLDFDKTFSFGKNKRSDIIRHLDDLSERSHYSLKVEQDEVSLRFTLNL